MSGPTSNGNTYRLPPWTRAEQKAKRRARSKAARAERKRQARARR